MLAWKVFSCYMLISFVTVGLFTFILFTPPSIDAKGVKLTAYAKKHVPIMVAAYSTSKPVKPVHKPVFAVCLDRIIMIFITRR